LQPKELNKRMFVVYKFNNSGSDYVFLQNHIEARPDKELDDGETEFNRNKYQYRLKIGANNFNCLIEGRDFEITDLGRITFL